MKANELRIGNYYQWDGEGKFLQIGIEQLQKLIIGTTLIMPIPITEELLLKLGYLPCNFRDNYFVISGHSIWKCNDMFMCDKNGIVLKWVHQLQNLYFILNNQELKFKDEK